jgi:hypothetical protein
MPRTNYTDLLVKAAEAAAVLDAMDPAVMGASHSRVSMSSGHSFPDDIEISLFGAEGYLFLSHGVVPRDIDWYGIGADRQASIAREIAGVRWSAIVSAQQWTNYLHVRPVPS